MNKADAIIQREKLEKFERIEKALKIIEKIQSNMKTEKFNYFEGSTFGMKFSSKEVIEKFNAALEIFIDCDKKILIKELEEI